MGSSVRYLEEKGYNRWNLQSVDLLSYLDVGQAVTTTNNVQGSWATFAICFSWQCLVCKQAIIDYCHYGDTSGTLKNADARSADSTQCCVCIFSCEFEN